MVAARVTVSFRGASLTAPAVEYPSASGKKLILMQIFHAGITFH